MKAADLDDMAVKLEGLLTDLAKRPSVSIHHATLSPDRGSVFSEGPEVWDYEAIVTATWVQGDQRFLYTSTGHTVNFTLLMSKLKDLQEELTTAE